MAIRITRPAKSNLLVDSPVMNAAGTLGFGDEYRDLIDLSALGAFVTNPLTYASRSPANGTRVVPLSGGVLVHTGLPNLGVSKVVEQYRAVWERLPVPVIAHLVVNAAEDLHRSIAILDREPSVEAVEFGLNEEMNPAETEWAVRAALGKMEKPLLVQLPFSANLDHFAAAIDAGAHALVVSAPPRGTARDQAGQLVAGRVYGPLVKPIILRMVGQLVRRFPHTPIIGAGGIHSQQDALDYLEAGAVAVQIDSATWVTPSLIEEIARELSGMDTTQAHGTVDDLFGEAP